MKRSVRYNILNYIAQLTRRKIEGSAGPSDDRLLLVEEPLASICSSGVVVRDFDVSNEYAGAIRRVVPAIGMQRGRPSREVVLNVFEAREVAVTTIYLPIDLKNGRLFINQTYEGMLAFWSPRARIADGRYEFKVDAPITISRRSVIIGGPIDGNYYHWMLNWLSRLAILKILRPDILEDPSVALFMDFRARAAPYVDFLHALGIGDDRLIWVDHTKDYVVKHAVLVSFGNQHEIAPAVVGALRDMFANLGAEATLATHPRRLWISRQQLGPNRRRIHNMEDVRPLLEAYGLEEVALEGRSIAEQIALFQNADFIASVHGAGLTNIIFSSPGCRVLALDSSVHVKFGASFIYEALAQACGLEYRSIRTGRAPRPQGVERTMPNMHNQDLIVSVDKLDAVLREMLGPPIKPIQSTT